MKIETIQLIFIKCFILHLSIVQLWKFSTYTYIENRI